MSRHLGGYVLFAAVSVSTWSADIPVAQSVEPRNGAPGTTLTIKGNFLDKEKVEEVYLTDHRFDLKVKVLEQDVNHLKIRIPPFAKPGRHQLLFLAKGTDKVVYLEQPVYVQVEEAAEAAAAASPAPAPPEPTSVAPAPPPTPAPTPAVAETKVKQNAKPRISNADPPRSERGDRRKAEERKTKTAETREVAAVQPPRVRPEPAKPVEAEPPPPAPLKTEAAKPPEAVANSPATDTAAPAAATRVTTPVQVVKQSPPAYPTMARQMRIAGVVSLEVVVSAEGKVERVKIVDGHPLLNDAAASAVKNWGYRAATLQGQPVTGTIPITVRFNLPR